jgi:copper chaperone CopZ
MMLRSLEGMDCAACASGIVSALTRHESIAEASVDYEKGTATVNYLPGMIATDRTAELITEQGFKATFSQEPLSQGSAPGDSTSIVTALKIQGMT